MEWWKALFEDFFPVLTGRGTCFLQHIRSVVTLGRRLKAVSAATPPVLSVSSAELTILAFCPPTQACSPHSMDSTRKLLVFVWVTRSYPTALKLWGEILGCWKKSQSEIRSAQNISTVPARLIHKGKLAPHYKGRRRKLTLNKDMIHIHKTAVDAFVND